MAQMISVTPKENGTAIVTIIPKDEDGVALTFAQLIDPEWQLMRRDGTVVNDRTFESSSMTSLEFILSGEDLEIFNDGDSRIRFISFQAKYNSTIGSNLPLIDAAKFEITSVIGQ